MAKKLAAALHNGLYSQLANKTCRSSVPTWRRRITTFTRQEFEDLFERAAAQAQRILKDRARAEDVAAEAMGRLIVDGKDRRNFKLIVHGLTVDAYRALGREAPWDGQVAEDEEDKLLFISEPLTIEQVEFREDFDRALRDIPVELDRQAFLLTTVRGLTFEEAADVLDISTYSVHAHAERARNQIKEAIA